MLKKLLLISLLIVCVLSIGYSQNPGTYSPVRYKVEYKDKTKFDKLSEFTDSAKFDGHVLIGNTDISKDTIDAHSKVPYWADTANTFGLNIATHKSVATQIAGITPSNFFLSGIQALGSLAKGYTLCPGPVSTGGVFTSQRCHFVAVYLPTAATITGIRLAMHVLGVYNAGAYNGIGLYTQSGGTLTLVASSTNDTACWKTGAGGDAKTVDVYYNKAFSSPYPAAVGVYYVGLLYTRATAAGETAPQLQCIAASSYNKLDFTNSNALGFYVNTLTALPSPSQAASGASGLIGSIPFLILY